MKKHLLAVAALWAAAPGAYAQDLPPAPLDLTLSTGLEAREDALPDVSKALTAYAGGFDPQAYGYGRGGPGAWKGHTRFFAGEYTIREDYAGPDDYLYEIGVLTDFRQDKWPVNGAADVKLAWRSESAAGISVSYTEFIVNFGVRKVFGDKGLLRPYVGAGLSLVLAVASVEISGFGSSSDSEVGMGFWLSGGLLFFLKDGIMFGFEVEYSRWAPFDALDAIGDSPNVLHIGISVGGYW